MNETARPIPLDKLPQLRRDAVLRLEGFGAKLSIFARWLRDRDAGFAEEMNCTARSVMLEAALLDEGNITADRLGRVFQGMRAFAVELPKAGLLAPEAREFIEPVLLGCHEVAVTVAALVDCFLDVRAMRRFEQARLLRENVEPARSAPIDADQAGLVVHIRGEVIEIVKDRAGMFPVRVTYPQLLEKVDRHLRLAKFEAGPCPDGDACPDAKQHGAVHPAPFIEARDGNESLASQIDRLADWFLKNAPGEIEGGAVDTAIKTLEKHKARWDWLEEDPGARLADVGAHVNTYGLCSVSEAIDAARRAQR